ncbi:MAG: hypothetical protein ACI822_002029, partial [Gammaproteobacteria bacterium]
QYGEHRGNTAVKVEDLTEIFEPENSEIKNAIAKHK